jgi:hypothetical protein
MDLKHLNKFHKIKPDAEYARRSRTLILMETPKEVGWMRRASMVLAGALESGSAIALTGALLFLALGGASIIRLVENNGGLSAADLRAEAQAIDIQIQLTDLHYNAMPADAGAHALPKKNFKIAGFGSATGTVTSTAAASTSSAPSAEESIDDALDQLSLP